MSLLKKRCRSLSDRAVPIKQSSSVTLVDSRELETETLANESYRRVVHTVPGKMQLVLMSLQPSESIPNEQHDYTAQFIRVEQGTALVTIEDSQVHRLDAGDSIIIPPKTWHKVTNATVAGCGLLKIYTIYTPPEHPVRRHQQRQPKK